MTLTKCCLPLLAAALLQAQAVDLVRVVAKAVERKVRLPGELLPYQSVSLRARVAGFVETVLVDRGSQVRKGQLLITLSAPELIAQLAEAEAKVQAAEAQRVEVEAQAASAGATWKRLKAAAATPGAIAGQELDLAEKAWDAARAHVSAVNDSARAARAATEAVRELRAYLKITAPFDGVITERRVHPGALAGSGALLELEQNQRLRLVVAVPEAETAGIEPAARVAFTVPAYPGRTFTGVVARPARSLEPKTRTMPVELDVDNARGALSPGMYAEVAWPVRRQGASLLVPLSSIVTTTERMFVIRASNGRAEYVTVSRGAPAGDLVEVFGPLHAGDEILRRASDEIRAGTVLRGAAR